MVSEKNTRKIPRRDSSSALPSPCTTPPGARPAIVEVQTLIPRGHASRKVQSSLASGQPRGKETVVEKENGALWGGDKRGHRGRGLGTAPMQDVHERRLGHNAVLKPSSA